MSTSALELFTHDSVDDAYAEGLNRVRQAREAHGRRMAGASLPQLVFDSSLHVTHIHPKEYTMDAFLSFRAQEIPRRLRAFSVVA